jgi:hypothetical protein
MFVQKAISVVTIIMLIMLLNSCSNDAPVPIVEEKIDPLKGLPDEGPVRFDNLIIGQRSYYIYFRAFNKTDTEDIRFEYKTDTLVIAVTGKESDRWILKEFITEGSTFFSSDTVFTLSLRFESDVALFAEPSDGSYYSNFFAIRNGESIGFPMILIAEPSKENPTCSPFASINSNEMEFARNYTQFGQNFEHVNIYQDYTATATDGPGLMYVYSPADGFVRMTVFNPWVYDQVTGWDLIP